jgi:hypothetical protein
MEKGQLLSLYLPLESQWMGTETSSWLTGTTIVSAKSRHRAMYPLWRALAPLGIKTEKVLLGSNIPLESQWMGAGTSLWLKGTTIVSAKSHHRVMCPLWRALLRMAIEMEKGMLLSSISPGQ